MATGISIAESAVEQFQQLPLPTNPRFVNRAGMTYGSWEVVCYAGKAGNAAIIWLCKCRCGTLAIVPTGNLISGKSAGCQRCFSERHSRTVTYQGATKTITEWAKEIGVKDSTLRHRLLTMPVERAMTVPSPRGYNVTKTPEYQAWMNARKRCGYKKMKGYHNYGGRGIRMCAEWDGSFDAFLRDVGRRPSQKHTLDRRDNSKGYEPGNVAWVTRQEQQRNRRNNRRIRFDGKTMTLVEWAEVIGLSVACLRNRINAGWTIRQAFTSPVEEKQPKPAATAKELLLLATELLEQQPTVTLSPEDRKRVLRVLGRSHTNGSAG